MTVTTRLQRVSRLHMLPSVHWAQQLCMLSDPHIRLQRPLHEVSGSVLQLTSLRQASRHLSSTGRCYATISQPLAALHQHAPEGGTLRSTVAPVIERDRIASDGTLIPSTIPPSALSSGAFQAPVAGVPPTAPAVPPISEAQLQQLVDFVHGCRRLVVLTGAGVSTESHIPDYRGPRGAYSTGFKPMTHQQFMADAGNRARYWARNFAGWPQFKRARPNAAHEALARLQGLGWAGTIITQNVDRLHHQGGSTDVLELHGTTHRVICMSCGDVTEREPFQAQLAALNPAAAQALEAVLLAEDEEAVRARLAQGGTAEDAPAFTPGGVRIRIPAKAGVQRPDGDMEPEPALQGIQRPDGDVELAGAGRGFTVPPCPRCGGILKPHVVFFGDGLPPERTQLAMRTVEECDGMLVVGSSLAVYSAYRLAKAAKAKQAGLAMVVVGPTRADDIADLKVEALAGEAMLRLASDAALLVPRPYESLAAVGSAVG